MILPESICGVTVAFSPLVTSQTTLEQEPWPLKLPFEAQVRENRPSPFMARPGDRLFEIGARTTTVSIVEMGCLTDNLGTNSFSSTFSRLLSR